MVPGLSRRGGLHCHLLSVARSLSIGNGIWITALELPNPQVVFLDGGTRIPSWFLSISSSADQMALKETNFLRLTRRCSRLSLIAASTTCYYSLSSYRHLFIWTYLCRNWNKLSHYGSAFIN
jgi:hypothetical protein